MKKKRTHLAAAAVLPAILLLLCLAGCQRGEVVGGSVEDQTAFSAPASAPEPTAKPGPDAGRDTPGPNSDELLALFGEWSEQGVYTNTVLGLQYTLPEGWSPISREETLAVANILIRDGAMDEKAAERIRTSPSLPLMAARDSATGDNALIIYDARENMQQSKEEYAEMSGQSLEQTEGEFGHIVGESYSVEAGGIEFLALPVETSLGDTRSRQLSYICELDGHILDIIVTAMGDVPPDELAGGISAFSFG